MKKTAVLLALASFAAAGHAQTNLLTNPHFLDTDGNGELGDGWGRWGATSVNAFWVGVPHAVLWTDLIDNSGGHYQAGIEAVPGATYTFSITNMRIEENFNANFYIEVEFWDEDEAVLLDEVILQIDSNEELGDVPTGNALSFSVSGVAPAGTGHVRPIIAFDGSFPVEAEQVNAFVFGTSLTTDADTDPGEPSCPADMDDNGIANVQDLLAYLNAFRAGCPDE